MLAIVQEMQMTEVDPNSLRKAPLEKEQVGEEDVALMSRVAAGEDSAIALLVDKWKRPLIRFFHRSLQSQADAEELSQITFLKLSLLSIIFTGKNFFL